MIRSMKRLCLLFVIPFLAGCGTLSVGTLVDTGYIAAQLGSDYISGCKTGTLGSAFEVDWRTNSVRYGGSVFLGCDESGKLYRLKCVNDKGKTVCEPIETWYRGE